MTETGLPKRVSESFQRIVLSIDSAVLNVPAADGLCEIKERLWNEERIDAKFYTSTSISIDTRSLSSVQYTLYTIIIMYIPF